MSSSTDEGGKDYVNITVTALIHSPKNKNRFLQGLVPRNEQNKRNTKTQIIKKTQNIEVKSKNKLPIKKQTNNRNVARRKQTIILKPLISTTSETESKANVEKSSLDSPVINEKECNIFVKRPKRISSSSLSSFPDLDIEIQNKNKPKSKSSLSSIFSSASNSEVKEKCPQTMQREIKREYTEESIEEIDFIVRSAEPPDKSIQMSTSEDILTVANIIAKKSSTPKSTKKIKKFVPVEVAVCVTENIQMEIPLKSEIISKKKRLVKEGIHKHKYLKHGSSFDSVEPHHTLKPTISNELLKFSNDFVPHSWANTGQPVPSERKERLIKLLRYHEKTLKDISQIIRESKLN